MFNLNCFNTISNFILISWKVWEKMESRGFALRWPHDPHPRSRIVKVVQNGRNQRCLQAWQVWIKNWPRRLHVMSNIKVFVTQDCRPARKLAGPTNRTHYINPCDTLGRIYTKHPECCRVDVAEVIFSSASLSLWSLPLQLQLPVVVSTSHYPLPVCQLPWSPRYWMPSTAWLFARWTAAKHLEMKEKYSYSCS